MENKKPDFWNDLPQVLGNWPNLAAIFLSTYIYYQIEGHKEVLSIVIFALCFSFLLYTLLYLRKYYIYKKNERKNALLASNECPDCDVISVEYTRTITKTLNECTVKRTLVSKINGLKYYRYRYSVQGGETLVKAYSNTHDIRYEVLPKDSNQWGVCLITFIRPLRYKEYAQIECSLAGYDWKPIQFFRVNSPTNYFSFRINIDLEAPHPAKLYKIPIDSKVPNIIEQIDSIDYNIIEKCFFVRIDSPHTGYTYQLNWEVESE